MLRKFRIRTRLLISFFILVFFTFSIGLTGFLSLTRIGNMAVLTIYNVIILNDIYDYNTAVYNGINSLLYVTDPTLAYYVLQTTIDQKEEMMKQIERYLEIQEQFSDVFTPGEMQDMINVFEVYKDEYIPLANEIFALAEQGQRDEAITLFVNRLAPLYNSILYIISKIYDKTLEHSVVTIANSNQIAWINSYIMLAIALLSLVISIMLALSVTKSIAIPLSELEISAEKIANGEFDLKTGDLKRVDDKTGESKSNDEIAYLSLKLKDTLQYLHQAQELKLEAINDRYEKEKAQASARSKSKFLAKMSHEIRTPMNAIIGMTELAMREEMPAVLRDYIFTIKQAGANLLSIINDILDFTKIDSGKMEIVPVEYSLSSLVNNVVNVIRMKFIDSNIHFRLNIDKNIPGVLIGDETRIRQILLNILDNAFKYTQKGSVSLVIYGEIIEDIVNLTMEVSDTGRGIRRGEMNMLFDDFVQVDMLSNKGIEGTGLGLAISHGLVKVMNGDISVASEYGKGSTFTIKLPQIICKKEKAELFTEKEEGNTLIYKPLFTAPGANILLVDDNETNLKVVEGLLSPYKMNLDSCFSGFEAIKAVMNKNYDIIFMDHMMPDMDGVETTGHIRSWEREKKNENENNNENPHKNIIIALTANTISGMREMFLERDFDDFLAKPINIPELDKMLDRWLPQEKKSYSKEIQVVWSPDYII